MLTEERMKRFGMTLVMSLGILAVMALPAMAFHEEGVASCSGCHTMHNSENGQLVDATAPNGNPYLLKFAKATDVCLSCHITRHGKVWGTDPLAPPPLYGAGNFVFLQEDNLNDGYGGATSPIPGRAGGHNVISLTKNSPADPVLSTAPGGNYPSGSMSCTSCHDPHGNANFRMLYGAGHVEAGNANFANAAPVAEGVNIEAATGEAAANHTAYQGGMSAWCSNCHGNYHNNTTQMRHPSGVAMGASIAQTYSLYNGTANQTGGNAATAYLPDVPFEDASNTVTGTAGPSATSQVSCISCHRAHATSAPNIGRWDFALTFLDKDGVNSGSYRIPDPYASSNQRSLCNKCHNKDANDGNPNP
jgi:hypothetical protein